MQQNVQSRASVELERDFQAIIEGEVVVLSAKQRDHKNRADLTKSATPMS